MFKFYEMVTAIQNIRFDKIRTDTRGVTALEYGLIAALIGGVIVVGVGLAGTGLTAAFTNIKGELTAASQ